MFNRILVPLDDTNTSLRALKPAEAFAKATGAELVVATVLFAEVIDAEERSVALADRAKAYGVTPDRAEVRVSPISVEEGIADLIDADTLVVIGSVGHPHTQKPFGNVSEEIIHSRRDGLSIIVGPKVNVDEYTLAGPMFAAVDPTAPSTELLDAFARVSQELGMAPWLVSVVQEIKVPAGLGGLPSYDLPLETNQLHQLARAVEERGTATVNYEVLHHANAAKEVNRFAKDWDASLIAVATRDRGGLSRLLFGSVAIDIIRNAAAPVLAVHTDRTRK